MGQGHESRSLRPCLIPAERSSFEGSERVPALFDAKQLEEERIAAVQYIRFVLGDVALARLRDPAIAAVLRLDHPHYHAETPLDSATRTSLLGDLAGGCEALLDLTAARTEGDAAARTPSLQLVAPAEPAAPGHVVLEAQPPISFLDADPVLLAQLAQRAQEAARVLSARPGGCRLEADLSGPVRWHLIPTSS